MNATHPFRPTLGLLLLLGAWGCSGSSTPPAVVATGPAALSVACSAPAALVRSPIAVQARVLKADGTPVAAGTAVSFVPADGGVISDVSPTDAAGNASARLTSATRGTVSVTVRAGSLPPVVEAVAFLDPTVAVVKVRTTGTLPPGTSIGGVHVIVSASPSAGVSIGADDHVATGAAAGALLVANPADVASDSVALIKTAGFAAGEFATLTYRVAPGSYPVASDFTVVQAGPGVIDTAGVAIPGAGVAVASVSVE